MIQISNLSKSYPSKIIYDNASLTIFEGEKIGLIGRNGVGKSTLLEIINDNIGYEGDVNYISNLKFGYYTQDLYLDTSLSVMDILYKPFDHLFEMEKNMLELSYDFEKNQDEYNKIFEEFEMQGGYFISTNINQMISKFKLHDLLNQKVDTLSGGQKGRVALAKVLLENPDVLLLDEPLNHLDIEAIEWLETFLNTYDKTLVVISHDRYFLDNVCKSIVEVKQYKLFKYKGNYSAYLSQSDHTQLSSQNEYDKQQSQIKSLKQQIKQYRIWGNARDSEKMFKKAKELEKRLSKIDVLENPYISDKSMRLKFNSSIKSGFNVLWTDYLKIGYDETLIDNIKFDIYLNDKVAFIGPNGTGKSTLLKIFSSKLNPLDGEISFGSNVKIGYFDQIFENLNKNNSIIDEIHDANIMLSNYELRSHLAKFLFTNDDLNKSVSCLSGGECVRVALAKLSLEDTNVLVLDEPTNHLDLESKEILEDALLNYDGTIIFSSHDRYFINKIATRLFDFSNEEFKLIDKSYDEYILNKSIESKEDCKIKSEESKSYTKNKENRSLLLKKAKIEEKVELLQNELKELEDKRFDFNIYTSASKMEELENLILIKNNEIEKQIEILCNYDMEG